VSDVRRTGTENATPTGSTTYIPIRFNAQDRRTFIGGSDARIIMGDDEADLIRLWAGEARRGQSGDLSV
jgi:hypothetical protein